MASCFGCFKLWREEDQKLQEQRLQAFKELEDIQAGVGTLPAPTDAWGPDIAAKLTKKAALTDCEADGHSNPETASSIGDERTEQQKGTALIAKENATDSKVAKSSTDVELDAQHSSDQMAPAVVFSCGDTGGLPPIAADMAPAVVSMLPASPMLSNVQIPCIGAVDDITDMRLGQRPSYRRPNPPGLDVVVELADPDVGSCENERPADADSAFVPPAKLRSASRLAVGVAPRAGAGASSAGGSVASAAGAETANCSSGGACSTIACSSQGGCGSSVCECGRFTGEPNASDGGSTALYTGGTGTSEPACREGPQPSLRSLTPLVPPDVCTATAYVAAPMALPSHGAVKSSVADACAHLTPAIQGGSNAGCGGAAIREPAASASVSVCSASHVVGSAAVSSSSCTTSTTASGAAANASPGNASSSSYVAAGGAPGRGPVSHRVPAVSCVGSRSSSTASAAASAAAFGGHAATPTSDRGCGGCADKALLDKEALCEQGAGRGGPPGAEPRVSAAGRGSERPSADAFATPDKLTPPAAMRLARSPASSRNGWGGGGGGGGAPVGYYNAGRPTSMHKPSCPSPQRNHGSGGKGPSSRAGVGTGAGRQPPSPCVSSFGGAAGGSGLHRGSGAGSSSGRYTPVYGASFAGGRNTPPIPVAGVFTSASTRLALHDVLHHRSRGLGAVGGRSGFSVSSLANVDFRPAWRY